MYSQAILILILIDAQYEQQAPFSLKKGWNGPHHTSSSSHHPVKKILSPSKISDSPLMVLFYDRQALKTFNKFRVLENETLEMFTLGGRNERKHKFAATKVYAAEEGKRACYKS